MMEITKVQDYVEYRIRLLSEELSECTNSYEHNLIQIGELNKKITELETTVDEGFEMFSPIASSEKNFNSQEVKNLQLRMYMFIDENDDYKKKMNDIKNEMNILKVLYRRGKADEKISDCDNLIVKLEECVKYCDTDVHRVKIELNNLIEILKK